MDYIKVVAPDPPKLEYGSWTAESIEKINDNLYKFVGLSFINNSDSPVIVMPGKHFIGAYNNFYWHFIHEDLANYEGLKLEIPDLSLSLIDIFNVMKDECTLQDHTKGSLPYLDFFLNLYPQSVYINRHQSNVYFEEAYHVLSTGDLFTDQTLFDPHGLAPMSIYQNPGYDRWLPTVWNRKNSYGPSGLNVLDQKIKLAIKPNPSLPKKIFISRKDVNSRLVERMSNPDYDHLIKERYYDDSSLEKYFVDKGYVSLALEEIPYTKQLQYFMNASHVAGVVGAGFSKLFVSSPGTKLIELHTIPIYGFNYGYFAEVNNIEYLPVDLRNLDELRTMTIYEMIGVLDDINL